MRKWERVQFSNAWMVWKWSGFIIMKKKMFIKSKRTKKMRTYSFWIYTYLMQIENLDQKHAAIFTIPPTLLIWSSEPQIIESSGLQAPWSPNPQIYTYLVVLRQFCWEIMSHQTTKHLARNGRKTETFIKGIGRRVGTWWQSYWRSTGIP